MAWIQVHQQLKDHRKLLSAADTLEIEPAHMLGLIVSFWLWALDNAPTGSLHGISSRMIARAAQWGGDPDALVAALSDAGFIKITTDGMELHDWYEYAGKLIDQREAEKNRSRRRRAAASAAKAKDGKPTDGRPTDDQQKTGGRVDQSRVDQSRVNKEEPPIAPEGATEAKQDAQERRFAEFWEAYPKKVGKKDALSKWNRLKPDADLFERIMQAVTDAKKSEEWKREGGRFIPNPSTWINQGRWDDELTPTADKQTNETRYQGHAGNNGNHEQPEQREAPATLSGFRMADD